MNWLLKITDGPMKGAEIALTNGLRLKVGRGDDCDIVIADASLGETAFELDVSEEAVNVIGADGIARVMKPFESHAFGTTAVAVGPAEGAWEEIRPVPAEGAPEEPPAEAAPASAGTELASSGAETAEAAPAASGTPATEPATPRRSKIWLKALTALVLLVALLAAAVASIWFFREPLAKQFPKAAEAVEKTMDTCREKAWVARVVTWFRGKEPAAKPSVPVADVLKQIAKAHKLAFTEKDGVRQLAGNVAKRTERLAIRALALAQDRYCQFDLSDDESFRRSVDALLFTVTEGAIKTQKAANREVTLTGYAPDATALARVLAALRSDVPHVGRTLAKEVRVGGRIPPELEGNAFARTGQLAERAIPAPSLPTLAALSAVAATGTVTRASETKTASGKARENTDRAVSKKTETEGAEASAAANGAIPADERSAATLAAVAAAQDGLLPKNVLPVAGILTQPYACVVLNNGHLLVEGAKISGLEITKIEATRITFVWRGATMRWEP